MCYDLQHIWAKSTTARFWHLERWTKGTPAPPSRRPASSPYLWRMAPIRRSAHPLYFAPCAQILVVPKILRNCQMLGVAILTRGRVQVVMVAKLAVGGQARRTPIWGEAFGRILMDFSMNIEIWEQAFSRLKRILDQLHIYAVWSMHRAPP